MVSTRERRMRNSALIREVNKRIIEVSAAWVDGEARELLCECGDEDCIEAIPVVRADYEATFEHPGRYLVTSNHSLAAGTRVLTTRDGLAIVEYRESDG